MAQPQQPGQGNEVPNAPAPQLQQPLDAAQATAFMREMHNQLMQQNITIARLEKQQSSNPIRPPKPDTFDGRHCDTFIYSLEKLFDYHGEMNSERRVALAVTFLRGSALRWYKCAERQDTTRQLQQWPSFIQALKDFFEAANTETLVRNKLANLRQLSSVAKYNDLFNGLIIELNDLDPRSKLDMYMRGLKPQVQLHVTLKEPHSLETAQRLALNVDGILVETGFARPSQSNESGKFKSGNRSNNNRHHNNRGRSHHQSSGGQSTPMELGQAEQDSQQFEYEQEDESTVASAQSNYKGTNRLSSDEQKKLMREGKCFSCGEFGHIARECPQRLRQHPKND